MKWFSDFGLRGRLALIILLVILPSLGLTVYHASNERKREIRAAQADVSREAKIIAVEEERLFDEARELLLALSHIDAVRRSDPKTCNRYLSHLLEHFQRYTNIGVVDLKGNVLCSAIPLSKPTNIADREYFQQAIAKREFTVGEFQIGRITGRPGLNMAYPIVDDDEHLKGIIYIVLDIEQLGRLEKDIFNGLRKGTTITKIDSDGTILSRLPDKEGWPGKQLLEFSAIEPLLGKGEGTAVWKEAGGEKSLLSVAMVPGHLGMEPIYVVLSIPVGVLYQGVEREFIRNIAMLAIIALLIFVAGWVEAIPSIEPGAQTYSGHATTGGWKPGCQDGAFVSERRAWGAVSQF